MITLGWVPQLFSLELRKIFAYRVDFWMNFAGNFLVRVGVAFFLWQSIFEYTGKQTIGGYTFQAMVLYYMLVPLMDNIILGQSDSVISREIYDGTINRYLIYPMPFFGYKFVAKSAHGIVFLMQLLIVVFLFPFFIEMGPDNLWNPKGIFIGTAFAALSAYCFFCINACVEFIAFWADNVWSLNVLLRFCVSLLGGGLLPLSLFPEQAQSILMALPFPYLLNVPIRIIQGNMSLAQIGMGALVLCIWTMVFRVIAGIVWKKGTRNYSGIGM